MFYSIFKVRIIKWNKQVHKLYKKIKTFTSKNLIAILCNGFSKFHD